MVRWKKEAKTLVDLEGLQLLVDNRSLNSIDGSLLCFMLFVVVESQR